MKYMKKCLDNCKRLTPIATDQKADYANDSAIKCVVFDIYGTLLISASGDVDQAVLCEHYLRRALRFGGFELLVVDEEYSEKILQEILDLYQREIAREHSLMKRNGIKYPEVDILNIWGKVVSKSESRGWIKAGPEANIIALAFKFELLANPVYPMPGMKEVIETFAREQIPLGIISNAQFYTPVIVNYFLTDRAEDLSYVPFFDKDISLFSYKLRYSKPDISLFKLMISSVKAKYGYNPHEILYVGNDMYKDIYPASQLGIKTALFAGDVRSLRLRDDMPGVRKTHPDHVVSDLRQLMEIIKCGIQT